MRTIAITLGLILAALYLWAVATLATSQPVDLVWTVAPARTAPLSWMPGSAVTKQGDVSFLDVWSPDGRGGAVLLTVSRR